MPPDWGTAKLSVMMAAVRAKFSQHAGPRAMLLATARGKLGPLQVTIARPSGVYIHTTVCIHQASTRRVSMNSMNLMQPACCNL